MYFFLVLQTHPTVNAVVTGLKGLANHNGQLDVLVKTLSYYVMRTYLVSRLSSLSRGARGSRKTLNTKARQTTLGTIIHFILE